MYSIYGHIRGKLYNQVSRSCATAAWQKLVADFRAAPPEKPAGQPADGEPPPAPGLFV